MRNLQNKILLIFFAIGITIILGMGLFFINIVNQSNMIMVQEGANISEGGLNETSADIRIIMQAAILGNASAIILAHNHPSG